MGIDDRFDAHRMGSVTGTGPAVGVFVSAEQADTIALAAAEGGRIMMIVGRVDLTQPIPAEALAQLAVAVVEVDPAERKSVDRLVRLARGNPNLPVIAAIAAPDIGLTRTLVREGVADVISLPIDVDELAAAALDVQARRALPAVSASLAPLVAIVRSSGGCGATTLATHLATDLSRREWNGKGTLLADLDLQFGSVAAFLDVPRSGSIPDLVTARDRIDPYLIHSVATETGEGLAVLGVPDEISPMDGLAVDDVMTVAEELRRHFGLAVFDFPADWSNWSASLAYSADLILIVVELSLSSLRRARRCLDLFNALGIPPEKVQLVANKIDKRLFRPINPGHVKDALGREALGTLPAEADALRQAQDQGILVDAVHRRSPYAAAVHQLADVIEARLKSGGMR